MLISSHVGKIQNYRKFRWICVLPITALAYMLFSYTAVAGTSSSVYDCGTVIYAKPGFFSGCNKTGWCWPWNTCGGQPYGYDPATGLTNWRCVCI